MGLVDGKVALVTGAASGIGAASARLFAAEGARVMAVDINGEGVEKVAASIRADGGAAVARQVDVTDEDAVEAMVAAVVDVWGGLDCAHNNAGITDRHSGLTQLGREQWQRMIDVNLTSVFLCLKHELRHMVAQGGGAIVNTSSGAGVVAFPPLPHYVAAKHGVLGLTKCRGLGVRPPGHPGQRRLPRSHRDRHARREHGVARTGRGAPPGHAPRHAGPARGDRPGRRVAVLAPSQLRLGRVDARRRSLRLPLTPSARHQGKQSA